MLSQAYIHFNYTDFASCYILLFHYRSFHRSQSLERLSQHNHTNKGKDSSATILCLSLITIIVGVLAAIYITMFPTLPYENSDLAVTEHTLFSDNLLSIKKKYEISDDSILQVESGKMNCNSLN